MEKEGSSYIIKHTFATEKKHLIYLFLSFKEDSNIGIFTEEHYLGQLERLSKFLFQLIGYISSLATHLQSCECSACKMT